MVRSAYLGSLVFVLAALILPSSASAQPVLSVSPTSFSLQAQVGSNVPSQTVQVSNAGNRALKWSIVQPSVNWLSVSPTKGVNSGALTLSFGTSALLAGDYQTSFTVSSNAGSATVAVKVSMLAATSSTSPLVVTCPADITVTSSDGSAVVVTYSVTTSGGVAPVTVSGEPPSGSSFPVGTTAVKVTAKSSDGQVATCSFSVTVTYSSTSTTTPGPQSGITCPSGSVDIWPGASIQSDVNAFPATTTFCIRAGVHYLTAGITPKSGNTFIGEFGAVLDGSKWSTTDVNQGAFRAHNEDIDDVTIRNLVIRNMPQRGIHAYYWASDRWRIEHNEITANVAGVSVPNNSTVRNNRIHHNTGAGYIAWKAVNTVFEGNEISYNGSQKVVGSNGVTFRNNFVHHNTYDGIWYDTENTNALIEGNRVEDNGRNGIFFEVSAGATIRNNNVARSGDTGIFISTAKHTQIYGNTLTDNFRAIQYFLNCSAVGGGTLNYDLSDSASYNNTVRVGTRSGSLANGFGYLSTCTSTQVSPYLNGLKNLTFTGNSYKVPSTSSKYWLWGLNAVKYWNEWQGIGHDTTGTLTQ